MKFPIQVFLPKTAREAFLPLLLSLVPAGFPSPAEDYLEGKLDLNKHLIRRPASTFLVRVTGDSMLGDGIHAGDLLVVDRSLNCTAGRVVIAAINGELLVKRFQTQGGRPLLVASNPKYAPVQVSEESQFEVWGVVTHVIHDL